MQDFTLTTYKELLQELLANDYSFQTLENFIQHPNKEKIVILRHDVDRKPGNSLVIARIEKEVGMKASYYFRIVKESYDEDVIRQIVEMGHEIGYHYENLADPQITQIDADLRISHRLTQTHTDTYLISRRHTREGAEIRGQMSDVRRARARDRDPHPRGIAFGFHRAGITQIDADERQEKFRDELFELGICDFERNLEKFRELYPVKTICMHGSPLSKWDNRDLWKKYDYRDFGIIAEPYFDLNFDEVFYLTDTGRSWNNSKASVRDKVKKTEVSGQRSEVGKGQRSDVGDQISEVKDLRFRHTWDIILAAESGLLPDKIMINTHPQRWDDRFGPWVKELVWQNVKNVVKRAMLILRD